jgi:hypothetical protein
MSTDDPVVNAMQEINRAFFSASQCRWKDSPMYWS